MFFLMPSGQTRPSVLETNKDEDYHCRFARYCVGQANASLHNTWLSKIDKNKRFYKGDQWTTQEDVDTFLKDDDNQDRNRLAIALNVIRPMVEQYRGNAIRMNINFRVKSVSPHAINRREKALAENLHLTKIANEEGNPFGPVIKKNFPVGDNEAETQSIFNNAYVDYFVEDMNDLAKFVSERNKFPNLQEPLAQNMAFSGLAVMNDFEYAGHQQFRVVPSETFFWDRSAKRPDLIDSAFMGEVIEMFPPEIFEQYQVKNQSDREAIERYSQFYAANTGNYAPGNTQQATRLSNGKVPVYKVYWMDGQADTYGYVLDENGYEYLTKINYVHDGETEPRYTDKDLIKSKSARAKKLLGDKLSRPLYYDVLRMAIIIPKEIIGSCDANSGDNTNQYNDIVLEWGKVPYQETENLDYNTVKFPYKCYCWSYVDGEVLSPIDDAIDPQRFINRVFSMSENQLNNSGGSGVFIDEDLIEDTSAAARAMNQSKPVFIKARGRGMQNATMPYDNTRSVGAAEKAFEIISAMKSSIKETTGVNDAIQGQQAGTGDQLVGVTELMIQRGSLMQEPFYNGITIVFEQCFNAICSRGKRIYADNERELTIAVGDDGARVLRVSKELLPEDFRTFVKRENSDEMLIQAANAQLLQFKQLMMLDDKRVANLWGRSTPDMVARALRDYAIEKEEIQRMSQKDQNAEQADLMQQAQLEQKKNEDAMHEQNAREDIRHLTEQKTGVAKEVMKNLGKIAPVNRKAQDLIINRAQNL